VTSLLHITTRSESEAAADSGRYVPTGFAQEGFVHCSHAHQVCRVADLRFAGRSDLVLLEIDPERLAARVVEENLEGGEELFPHVYGPIPMHSVRTVHAFPCDEGGRFSLPPGI
jgi:uncharacterized protein (DUF952 family)